MKGKKVDHTFLSEFISDCVVNGIDSPEGMLNLAKKKISIIDAQIKEVEKLKVTRSKLLDVITTFDKTDKLVKDEAKLLSLYKIQNPNIGEFICKLLKDKMSLNINSIVHEKYSKSDIVFCVKQLLESKVVFKTLDGLVKGNMFEDYCNIVRVN